MRLTRPIAASALLAMSLLITTACDRGDDKKSEAQSQNEEAVADAEAQMAQSIKDAERLQEDVKEATEKMEQGFKDEEERKKSIIRAIDNMLDYLNRKDQDLLRHVLDDSCDRSGEALYQQFFVHEDGRIYTIEGLDKQESIRSLSELTKINDELYKATFSYSYQLAGDNKKRLRGSSGGKTDTLYLTPNGPTQWKIVCDPRL